MKIIGICGGSCSGKTTLAKKIQSEIGPQQCEIVFQDSFYKDQSSAFDRDGGQINFDHPDAIDFELMASVVKDLRQGSQVKIPQYDFKTHKRMSEFLLMSPAGLRVILVDGTLILNSEVLRIHFDRAVFLDAAEALRLERRKKRDVELRGRSLQGVIEQFQNHVKPMHDQYVESSKQFAHAIFESSTQFELAAQKIFQWVRE